MFKNNLYINGILGCLLLSSFFNMSACSASDVTFIQSKNDVEVFQSLPKQIQNLAKSEKTLSILKLEYQIKSLPEFVVMRKLQSSVLQTFYTAFDIGFIASCYPSLDFEDKVKMKRFYSLFLGVVESYNSSSNLTISFIDQDLSRNDRYLDKQYPDFAFILSELRLDIIILRDFINDFVKDNIPDEYISDYSATGNELATKRRGDITLAHADYIPPQSFLEHLGKFLETHEKPKKI